MVLEHAIVLISGGFSQSIIPEATNTLHDGLVGINFFECQAWVYQLLLRSRLITNILYIIADYLLLLV